MPWCDTCDRLVDDEALEQDACPTCGTDLVEHRPHRVSWRFRLLVLLTIAYLAWRTVQGVEWLSHHV